ncbi:MAG: xanthine dehydrogenase accessory protein XdhC [Ketobacter sp.]
MTASSNYHLRTWASAAAKLQQQGEGYVLVTIVNVKGSSPRDNGTKMLVSHDRTVETIGGGHLEFLAIKTARELLTQGKQHQHMEEYPLGTKLGQCCGGRVTLLYECFAPSEVQIALFGAGHVARALITILAQLPVQIRWIDSRADEFPASIQDGVKVIVSDQPENEVAHLNPGAYVIVMTHLHPLDYAIAEAALQRNDTAYVGVIGSETKARRFRMRLQYWGFPQSVIDQMQCPIGLDTVAGKHPMEVSVSIAGQIIAHYQQRREPGISDNAEAIPIALKPTLQKQIGYKEPFDQ